jgi:outer membrane protein TolC
MPVAALLLCLFDPSVCGAQTQPGPQSRVPAAANPGRGDAAPGLPLPMTSPVRQRGDSAAPGSNPLYTGLKLPAAPLEPTDVSFPINLATALRLSDARPLIVAAAQARVWVAEAELTRAKVLWLPTLNLGFDYLRHDGGGPDFNKGIMTAPSVNFFYGGGGLTGNLSTTDAYFEPLARRQLLNARQWEIQVAKNDVLMQTSDAYFRVHQQRGMFAGALYSVQRGQELVDRIIQLSKELVPTVEIDRARNMLADLEQQAVSARQEWRVASADLTQVLRLDPRAVIVPLEHDHVQITMIDPGRPLDELMPIALINRPELGVRKALVEAMVAQVRREKARPFLPNILLNGFQTPNELLQAGVFGLGSNSSLNQWRGRDDFSIQPLWQLDAMGLGNLARIKEQRGNESMAMIEFFKAQDMVAGDVTRAQARVQSAAARVLQADRAMRTALITFNGNYEGLQQTTRLGDILVLVNRPQEAVFALQELKVAFDHYFTTVAEYNRAQFELFHALGYPAREIAELRPPGEIQPVDTSRPAYLPPVGNGPPPATR